MAPHILFGDCRGKFHLDVLKENNWGRIFATNKPSPYEGESWAFDNGAFKAWTEQKPFDEPLFLSRLALARGVGIPLFGVVPDIVAGGLHSLDFSVKWVARLRVDDITNDQRWPWYLAVQDGMTIWDVEKFLQRFDGIFLGGSDKFKSQAWKWCYFAHDHGKPFHYGRAGTLGKLESAMKMHADSLDSSFPLWTKARSLRFVQQFHYWKENPRPELRFE